ncbi:MAG TPA: hypothetical protein VHD57_07345 [Vicinamibacterales bacterium]|nr:hypothetical protein [Vicinamibacterales bacterium]
MAPDPPAGRHARLVPHPAPRRERFHIKYGLSMRVRSRGRVSTAARGPAASFDTRRA